MSRVLTVITRPCAFRWARSVQTAAEAVFNTQAFQLHRLTVGPKTNSKLLRDEALEYYYKMQVIRKLENSCSNLYREKIIRGFCHLCSGQEAIAVGIASVLRPSDSVISAYRIHGLAFVLGIPIVAVIAEMTGRKSGVCKGKGGSMHLYTHRFYGGSGIVGAQVPMGTGLAFAAKYLQTGGVSFTIYGDGAANQGQVFEAFNMAKLWNLPVVYICENNGFAMGTSTPRASAVDLLYTRGDFIPGIRVDGMDMFSVRESVRFAIEYVTSGKGPLLLEMVTYRFFGHSMSDPGVSYRKKEDIQEMRKTRDPILIFQDQITKSGLATEDEIKAIKTKVKQEVREAELKAKTDEDVDKSSLTADIYAEAIYPRIRATVSNESYLHSSERQKETVMQEKLRAK